MTEDENVVVREGEDDKLSMSFKERSIAESVGGNDGSLFSLEITFSSSQCSSSSGDVTNGELIA